MTWQSKRQIKKIAKEQVATVWKRKKRASGRSNFSCNTNQNKMNTWWVVE
jgi:hypothetical protein